VKTASVSIAVWKLPVTGREITKAPQSVKMIALKLFYKKNENGEPEYPFTLKKPFH
jgi:hypothetical protein